MRKMHLVCAPHVVPGKYLTYGLMYSGGNVIKQIRDTFWKNEDKQSIYQTMFSEIREGQNNLLIVPHLFGSGTPEMEENEGASILGLKPDTSAKEILQAAVEGLAFDARKNIENMEKCQIKVEHIRAAGGSVKAADAMQLRADILKKNLYIPEDVQAGARGVYYIAAKALGWIQDFPAGDDELKEIAVQDAFTAYYDRKYEVYKNLQSVTAEWTEFCK